MAPVKRSVRKPKYTPQDVAAGTKHEMEHTKGMPKSKKRAVAKKIALQHLSEHFSYYRVLPAAEATMSAIENRPAGKPRKKKKVSQSPGVMSMMGWTPKIQTPKY